MTKISVNFLRGYFLPGWGVIAQYVVAILLGVLAVLGFAPYGQWWLMGLVLGGFYGLIKASMLTPARSRRANSLVLAWLFGFGYFCHGLWWLYVSMHTYGGLPVVPAAALLALAAALLALFPLASIWLFTHLSARFGLQSQWSAGLSALVFASSWTAFELLRGMVLTGFPWLSVGYAAIDTVFSGYAPLVGVFGVSFFYILVVAWLVEFVWSVRRQFFSSIFLDKKPAKTPRWNGRGLWLKSLPEWRLLGLATVILLTGYGLSQIQWTKDIGPAQKIVVLQGNIDQATKWTQAGYRNARDYYIGQTLAHPDADIIVWPETAVPGFWRRFYEENQHYLEVVTRSRGQVALIGTPLEDQKKGVYYNAMVAVGGILQNDSNAQLDVSIQSYRKQHLVPFGEYVPFAAVLVPWFQDLKIPYSKFVPGQEGQPPLRLGALKVLPSICYEIIFGAEIASRLNDANWIVNISNDAWFGESPASYQHLEMARMRALELGRPLVRATNTGVSALINRRGEVTWQSAMFVQQASSVLLQPAEGQTPYVFWRDWAVLSLLLGVLLYFMKRTIFQSKIKLKQLDT